MSNPLLNLDGLPPYSRISPEQVKPAIGQLLSEGRQLVETLAGRADPLHLG